jgi:hypothetical protein
MAMQIQYLPSGTLIDRFTGIVVHFAGVGRRHVTYAMPAEVWKIRSLKPYHVHIAYADGRRKIARFATLTEARAAFQRPAIQAEAKAA